MFQELFQLSTKATLAMTISADPSTGLMTINIIPKPKVDHGEPALANPLSLTATPEELQAEFVNVLMNYRQKRDSLAAQAEVTNELLDAAKDASSKKGTAAVAKAAAPKPVAKAAAVRQAAADPDDDADDESHSAPNAAPAAPAPATASEPSLFGPGV